MSNHFHTIIIGGGAAGIMAAISAKRSNPELSVAIVDRTFALGRKILVCGAGRCNITNINLGASAAEHYYGADAGFVQAVLDQFGYQQIVDFFADLGIELYVERKTDIGKLFPITNQAHTVTELLSDELQRLGVKVFLDTEVCEVTRLGDKFSLLGKQGEDQVEWKCEKLVLSAGGKTYPALGSNGSGYTLAESLGHHIVSPVPSALPLEAKNALSQQLQGTKMEIEVTSIIEGKKIKTRTDDVMFTQYGLSGPAILNISREISIHINREHKSDAEVALNFFPGKSSTQVLELLEKRWEKRPDQTLSRSLFGIFPNKIPPVLLNIIGLNPEARAASVSDAEKQNIVNQLTDYRVKVTGTRGWNEAEFTAGGVDTTEVEIGKLESKIVTGLFFCGEILDVDGDVGGFNLSWAWASGYVAGQQQ